MKTEETSYRKLLVELSCFLCAGIESQSSSMQGKCSPLSLLNLLLVFCNGLILAGRKPALPLAANAGMAGAQHSDQQLLPASVLCFLYL